MKLLTMIGTVLGVLGIISFLILIFLVLSIALICYCNSNYEQVEEDEDEILQNLSNDKWKTGRACAKPIRKTWEMDQCKWINKN